MEPEKIAALITSRSMKTSLPAPPGRAAAQDGAIAPRRRRVPLPRRQHGHRRPRHPRRLRRLIADELASIEAASTGCSPPPASLPGQIVPRLPHRRHQLRPRRAPHLREPLPPARVRTGNEFTSVAPGTRSPCRRNKSSPRPNFRHPNRSRISTSAQLRHPNRSQTSTNSVIPTGAQSAQWRDPRISLCRCSCRSPQQPPTLQPPAIITINQQAPGENVLTIPPTSTPSTSS